MLNTNLALLKIARRAEQVDLDHLMKTFVDSGPVLTLLSSVDSQVIFGRRGTGKTHVLSVLGQTHRQAGEVSVQIDMRNLGSVGGIYADPTIPITQRATRLLVDTLSAIHERLLGIATESNSPINLGTVGPLLNELFDALHDVQVVGLTTEERVVGVSNQLSNKSNSGVLLSASPAINIGHAADESLSSNQSTKISVTGTQKIRVNFGSVGDVFRRLVALLPKKRIWVLLDEWSEIPLDLQPYLADLLRRSLISIPGISVKIAAIEQRTRFRQEDYDVGHIGIQLGADIATSLNLDEYMVFDNDERAAAKFFRSLIYKHVKASLEADNLEAPKTEGEFISNAFTQSTAFEELVRAAEGVPRDAINILGHAAQKADNDKISVPHVRYAAQKWYQAAKEKAVSTNPTARALLSWVIDNVIKGRRAKAFLLDSNIRDNLIDFLYDERVLHVLKQGVSAQDSPGQRFNVYGIDFGCYVDLILTGKAPQGYLEEDDGNFIEIPKTDLRSIRRSILNLAEFYKEQNVLIEIKN